MIENEPFAYVELPYCGRKTEEIARKMLPYYHCVFTPFTDEGDIREMASKGFYYRPFSTSQDLCLETYNNIEDYLNTLNAKRRNDIAQAVRKARSCGIEVLVSVFKRTKEDFEDLYRWYFDVYRPYASTHFPNRYKFMFIEEFNEHLLEGSFIFARAKWNDKLVGGSLLAHLPCFQYQYKSSFAAAFANAPDLGDVLQMYMLNTGREPIGNFNSFLYYSIIDWCISQNYRFFSFGRENMIVPPEAYLNVLGSKRAWGTTSVLNYIDKSNFLLCNRKALLQLLSDYYVFHWDGEIYWLTYFANDENVPKVLSQWLEGDVYIRKQIYTRKPAIYSYLEKRKQRWRYASVILCDYEGEERSSFFCP